MKTAIVTGASGNMGQAVVRKFLAEGYNVVGTIIPNDPAPFDIVDTKLEKVIVDLMNEEDSDKFIKTAVAKYGNIDAAVLTVGGFAMGKIADTPTADIYKQYKLNFETAYNVARPAFVQAGHERQRRKGDGSVWVGEVPDISPGRIDE
jgi:NAD(P)-dependent dehydrogenase (short-subunit alcohol dehydrogenase family)